MENAIAPADTSERPPRNVGDAPKRLANLARLLERENVDFVLLVVGAESLQVKATFDDAVDMKRFGVGDDVGDGCFVIMHLSDNPEGLSKGRFYDLSPTSDGGK